MRQVPQTEVVVFRKIKDWIQLRREGSLKDKTLGFVPTMGALHEGHLSLVRRSKAENEFTVVSIFVNPTQFDEKGDFDAYPQNLQADVDLLRATGADFILFPKYEELYADQYRYRVQENELSHQLCGAHRQGHFEGVLTVVMKLLQIAGADKAYFGEKDYQQYLLIKGMAEAFFVPTKIERCPTVRDYDGLALSSRNTRLNAQQRIQAADFPRLLQTEKSPSEVTEELRKNGFEVDYVTDREGRRFGAVRIGTVRLIDNVEI
jgi:pantoate--beta-alanine ligase